MTGPIPLCNSLSCAHFQVLQTVQKQANLFILRHVFGASPTPGWDSWNVEFPAVELPRVLPQQILPVDLT